MKHIEKLDFVLKYLYENRDGGNSYSVHIDPPSLENESKIWSGIPYYQQHRKLKFSAYEIHKECKKMEKFHSPASIDSQCPVGDRKRDEENPELQRIKIITKSN